MLLTGGRKGGTPVAVPIKDFTLLLASTDEYQLLQPLRDRMRLTLRFHFYAPEDLEQIVRNRCRSLGWEVEESLLPEIAQRSRGTPRLALRLLQAARRVRGPRGSRSSAWPTWSGRASWSRSTTWGWVRPSSNTWGFCSKARPD